MLTPVNTLQALKVYANQHLEVIKKAFCKRPQELSQPCVYLQNQVRQNDKLSLQKYVSQQNVLQPSLADKY